VADTSLAVEHRAGKGKGAARKLRAEGQIPAVLYGHGNDPVSLSLNSRALERLIQNSNAGLNTLIALEGFQEVSGKQVMIKELQREAVRGGLMHADLLEINAHETLVVHVPIHTTGIAVGSTLAGGLVDHAHRELEVSCLVTAIPDELVVDISALDIGDSIHAGEITLPDGVELKTDPSVAVISVVAPAKVEEIEVEGEEAVEGEGEAAADAGAADSNDAKGED
jgi:large subunit ribosomal protein L25